MASNEMDSLFEGMILFNPSQETSADAENQAQLSAIADVDADADDVSVSSSSSMQLPPVSNEPLDENLFSDLTLMTPSDETRQGQTPSDLPLVTPALSRQTSSSRRRKRAAGLRIGYGRDRDSASLTSATLDNSLPHAHVNSIRPASNVSTAIRDKGATKELKHELKEEAVERREQEANIPEEQDSSFEKQHDDTNSIDYPDKKGDLASDAPISSRLDVESMDVNHLPLKAGNAVELKFEDIKAIIADKLKLARETVMSVSALRKESIRRRRKALHDFSGASSRHRELEKKLDEACEAEDFETAERVSENLASVEKEKEQLVTLLRDAEAYCDVVDAKMQEALESLIEVEEECVHLLRGFSEEAASNADSVLMNAEAVSSKDSAEWLSSVEALEASKFELEIQSQLVHEAKSSLNESIDHSVVDDRREMDVLCKRKEVLAEDLRKLLALVKEKEVEIAENDALIHEVENRIDGVVSYFKEVQASVDNNYYALQSHLSALMAENEVLLKRKKDIDNRLSQEESVGEKIKNLSRISADEAKVYGEVVGLRKSLAMFISKSKAYTVSLAKSEEGISEELQFLKQETSAARSSLQELSTTKSSIQQEVESCKQRLLFIDRRIPELEAEKKVAATTRNFKEAARLAGEAKALSIEKEEIRIKTDSIQSELKKLEKEICDTVDRLQETEVQISRKEKELAMARFQRLILIARAAGAERSAALELGDHEEAEALVAEADAAEVEARKLQPIYGFKEEEIENLPKLFISSELVSMLGGKQLAELASSANIVAS